MLTVTSEKTALLSVSALDSIQNGSHDVTRIDVWAINIVMHFCHFIPILARKLDLRYLA